MRDYWQHTKFDVSVSSDAMRWAPDSVTIPPVIQHAPQMSDEDDEDMPYYMEDLWD